MSSLKCMVVLGKSNVQNRGTKETWVSLLGMMDLVKNLACSVLLGFVKPSQVCKSEINCGLC